MDTNKKPAFPRQAVIDRQIDHAIEALKIDRATVRTGLRAAAARYGLPNTEIC